MFIKSVELKNIRGFRELKFDFERGNDTNSYSGWTVLTGDNGSGKSALLKAIAVAIAGTDAARSLQPSFHRWIFEGKQESEEAFIEITVVRVPSDDSLSTGGAPPNEKFPAKIIMSEVGKETVPTVPEKRKNRRYLTPQRTIWATDARGWFSCGYGPFRRVFGASPEAMRQMVAPLTERFVTMFQEAASLAEVDQWLRNLKHKELEKRSSEKEQLNLVIEILRDELMPGDMTVDRVDSDGLWLRDKSGVELSWTEMSDGYRAALALMTDILRHLINTFGVQNLVGRDAEGKIFINRSGVVLIDEVDAHLHPAWQRTIGFWLKRHFPNIQFIVTSHSPLVCQAADKDGLFVLPEPGGDIKPFKLSQEDYEKVIASRPDTILMTPAFGLQNTRSPRAVEGRAKAGRLRSQIRAGKKLSEDEQKELEQLQLFVRADEEA